MAACLAGASLLLGDLSGTDVDTAGFIMIALSALALGASIHGFRPLPGDLPVGRKVGLPSTDTVKERLPFTKREQ